MKKTFLLLIPILMLLIGCAPVVAAPTAGEAQPIAPNVAAVYAAQTKQAAQQAEDFFNAQSSATAQNLTAVAYAPIATMTQAAAELQVQRMYAEATTTSAVATQVAGVTQTAISWTPTPNLTATVAVQAFLVQKDIDDKAAQRREFNNGFWAWATPILFILFVAGVIIAGLTVIRHLRRKPVARDENGKTQPMIDNVTGDYIDLSANPNYAHITKSLFEQIVIQWLEKKYGFVPNMPRVTVERMDTVKEREQVIEIERIRRARVPKALIDSQGLRFVPQLTDEVEQELESEHYSELPLPSWVQLNQWDGHLLPVGNDENSNLMLVDTSLRPHLLYAGRSRSGKTLTGERTAVACLLTQGWNVIVMGKRVDWMPFTDHPNFKLLAVDVRKDAQKYIDILQILSAQMDIRDSILTSKGIGTWGQYGAPSTMVVLDDYSGALIRMPAAKAKEVVSEVRSIALDGAKFGLSITIGLQDATAQNIDTTTRSQMARIVFSMDNATKSRIALGSNADEGPGAEYLPPRGHFLARVSDDANIRRGVGFWLQNNEVEAFLASRPVQQNGEMEWVDGVIVGQPALTSQKTIHLPASTPAQSAQPISKADFLNGLIEWEEQVLDLYEAGLDQVHIVEKIFAGDNLVIGAAAVADLIKRWQVVKGVAPAQVVSEQAAQYTDAEIDARIRNLHAQRVSNTNIVYEIWDKSSAEFSNRMARVKRVVSTVVTASALETPEMPQNQPLAA